MPMNTSKYKHTFRIVSEVFPAKSHTLRTNEINTDTDVFPHLCVPEVDSNIGLTCTFSNAILKLCVVALCL